MAMGKRSVFFKAVALVCAFIMTVLSFSSCQKSTGALSAKIGELKETETSYSKGEYHYSNEENLVFVTSSGLVEMYFDSSNYSIAVKDTNNDKMWYSLPLSDDINSKCESSIVSVKVSKDNKVYYLNSQDNSVAFDSATFRPTSGGIQITYNMALNKETAQAGFVENGGELYVSVTVIFSLSDGTLDAKINCGDIMLSDGYILETIEVMNFFGSDFGAGKNDFIFVPDQSGAVIKLGSKNEDEYETRNYRVYGKDISMGSLKNVNDEGKIEFANALVPAFGMKLGDNAFVGIILGGDTIASISSHRNIGKGSYDRVGASFRITDVTYSGKGEDRTKYIGEAYTGDVDICYRFLSGKSAGYAGFASSCREVLIREGVLPSNRTDIQDHIPFAVAVQGAVSKGAKHSYKVLSDYEQTLDMLVVMKAKSINDVSLRYCGVLDGANNQDVLSSAGPIGALGNKNEFAELKKYTDTQKFDMYLDISMVSANSKSAVSKNCAENMAGDSIEYVRANSFSSVAGKDTVNSYAIPLSNVEGNLFKFLNNSRDFQFDSFCINDAGRVLYSDYSKQSHNRNNAVNIISPQALMLSNNHKIMVEGGYFYILKNADYVTDISENTDYPETENYIQVPFVEIVLHGLLDYSLEAVNISENYEKSFMKAVEYGAIPAYKWYCSKIGNESADNVFYYENQLDEAAKKYALADEAIGSLRSSKITAHKQIKEGVYSTEYNNSVVIYFNYNDKAVTVNSVKVEANSFIRVN